MTEVVLKRRWHTVAEVAEMGIRGDEGANGHPLRRLQIGEGRQAAPDPARMGRRVRRPQSRRVGRQPLMARRQRGGFDIPLQKRLRRARVDHHPGGRRQRKSVYGKTREQVHEKWPSSTSRLGADRRPRSPQLAAFIDGWLRDVVEPNLAPMTASNYELFSRLYIVPDLGRSGSTACLYAMFKRGSMSFDPVPVLRPGKDASRDEPKCCAAGRCCRQLASEWTIHRRGPCCEAC